MQRFSTERDYSNLSRNENLNSRFRMYNNSIDIFRKDLSRLKENYIGSTDTSQCIDEASLYYSIDLTPGTGIPISKTSAVSPTNSIQK